MLLLNYLFRGDRICFAKQCPDANLITWWVGHTAIISVVLRFINLHNAMESSCELQGSCISCYVNKVIIKDMYHTRVPPPSGAGPGFLERGFKFTKVPNLTRNPCFAMKIK